MIAIPVMYHKDEYNDDIIDYTSMECEFRLQLNLLLDEEIRQDNDLNPGSRI